jgi:2-oxoglutarate dehydrogenase E2 component (dihydrolipoamide succinyltransferase)
MINVAFSSDQQEGTQSVISQWFKKAGEFVRENEPLVEVSTDKVNVEIAAPTSGTLTTILKNDGDEIKPGDILAVIDPAVSHSASTSSSEPAKTAPNAQTPQAQTASGTPSTQGIQGVGELLSPAVRRLLKEHGLEASQVKGSGRGGRITPEDILAHVARKSLPQTAGESTKSHLIPHSAMRKQIAHHMVTSLMHTAPHVTSVFEADLTEVTAHRERTRQDFLSKGVKLTFTSYFLLACARAVAAAPEVNSRWRDDGLEVFDELHIGVATAIEPKQSSGTGDAGLIVPVLRNVERLSLFEIAERLQQLTDKARQGSLAPHEVRGGTLTISNHGVSGSLFATPIIINQPQSAILGIGKLEQRASVIQTASGEELAIRPKVYITLTIDHRSLDGFKANLFLRTFVEILEAPWS